MNAEMKWRGLCVSHIIMLLLLPVGEGKIFKVKKSKKAATQKKGEFEVEQVETREQKGMTNKNFHAGESVDMNVYA